MVIKEYGKENTDTTILLHGGGLSWCNYRAEAEMLSNEFHVVLPILDGHAESDRDFIDIVLSSHVETVVLMTKVNPNK